MTRRRRLLLDTHIVLWWLADAPTLTDEIKTMIDDELEVFVSAATAWEVSIKQKLGKIDGPSDLPERILGSELPTLPITFDHAVAAGRLPLIHRDPFDRVLIAQAVSEDLTLVTRDPLVHHYPVSVLAA